jgi:hypothetical protein
MQYEPNAAEQSWRYCFHWVSTINRNNPSGSGLGQRRRRE